MTLKILIILYNPLIELVRMRINGTLVQAYIMYNQSSFECLYITLDTGFIVFRVPGGIAGLCTSGDPNSNGMSSSVC